MSQPENPYLLGLQALDDMDPMVKVLQGMKARFVTAGFTEQQAGDLTVESLRMILTSKPKGEE